MKKPLVFCSTLLFAALFSFLVLADDKGRGGMRRENKTPRTRSERGHHPKSAGQKPDILKDQRERQPKDGSKGPGRFDKIGDHKDQEHKSHHEKDLKRPSKEGVHVHVHKHYRSHDHHWFRSRWSFYADTGGLSFYYGAWDPYLGCHPYYYPRPHYHLRSWVALELYSYYYAPDVVCPIHGFCHHGHCEWYYRSDGGMVLFWYP